MTRSRLAAFTSLVLTAGILCAPALCGPLDGIEEKLRTARIDAENPAPPLSPVTPPDGKPRVMTRDLTITSADGKKVELKKGDAVQVVDLYRGNYRVRVNGTEVYVQGRFLEEAPAAPPATVAADPPKADPPKPADKPKDPAAETGTVRVGSALNVRSAPWGDIVGTLSDGDKVEIVGREGTWLKIKHGGGTAFVHEAYVESASKGPEKVIATGTVSVSSDLNVRSGPWGDILGSLNDGDKVEVLAKDGDWLKIKYNGRSAWVHKDYVSLSDGPAPPPSTPPAAPPPAAGAPKKGVVTCDALNVRSAPWGAIIGGLTQGAEVTIKRTQGEWSVIDYDGREAYVYTQYIGAPGSVKPPDTTPPATAGPGGFTFPVGQFCSFSTRSFNCHARGGSPFNMGVDIFGAVGRPLYACKAGTIRVSVNSLGGNALHVVAGNEDFYYAHLNRFGAVSNGQRVPAGYRVGDLGETGNAAGKNAPHLHFSMVRNGSETVDPTQLLIQSKHGEVRVSN